MCLLKEYECLACTKCVGEPKVGIKLLKLSHARMFSHPKILFLVPLTIKFNPYLPFEFLIILIMYNVTRSASYLSTGHFLLVYSCKDQM